MANGVGLTEALGQMEISWRSIGEKALALERANGKMDAELKMIVSHHRRLEEDLVQERESVHKLSAELERQKDANENLVKSNGTLEKANRELSLKNVEVEEERNNSMAEVANLARMNREMGEEKEVLTREKGELALAISDLQKEKDRVEKRLKGESRNARKKQNLLTAATEKLKQSEGVIRIGELSNKHSMGKFENFVNEMKQDGAVLAKARIVAAGFDHVLVSKNSKDLQRNSKRVLKDLCNKEKAVQAMVNSTERKGIKLEAKRLRLDQGGEEGGEQQRGGRGQQGGQGEQGELEQQGGLDQQGEEDLELVEAVVPGDPLAV